MSRGWVLAVILSAACSRISPSPLTLDALAEGYVRAALQLAQHDPQLVEEWRGPDPWRPGPRTPVQPIVDTIQSLQRNLDRASGPVDPDRRSYLRAQLSALHVAGRRLLGLSMPFDDEAREALGVSTPAINEAALAAARAALGRELPGPGALADRLSAFRKRFVVPAARQEDVMRRALEACRSATIRALPLPPDERVDVTFDSALDLDGSAEYLGRHRTRIRINRAAALDVSRALHLACHEGYPGHHVQFILIDEVRAAHPERQELALVPAFGRHLLVTEGAAEAATAVAFPAGARAAVYRDALFPAAGLAPGDVDRLVRVEELVNALEPAVADTIRGYLDNSLTQARATGKLRDEALTPEPESLLAFAERRRTRVLAYPAGRAAVQGMLATEGLAGLTRLFVDHPFSLP